MTHPANKAPEAELAKLDRFHCPSLDQPDAGDMRPSERGAWVLLDDVEQLFAAWQAARAQSPVEPVAWAEKDGDDWHVYDFHSDTGQHIWLYQKDTHYVSVFPIFATTPPASLPQAEASAKVEMWQWRVASVKAKFPSMTHEEAAHNALLSEVIDLRAALSKAGQGGEATSGAGLTSMHNDRAKYFDDFKAWAANHLGQGYSLDREDGTFIDPVTRWAFVAYKAGRSAQQAGDALDAARYRWLLRNYARGDGYELIDTALNDGEPERLNAAIDAAIAATPAQGED